MTQTTTIDGVSRTSVVKRKSCEWVEHAYLGEIGTGSFRIDDDAGTIAVVGHKTIVTEQSDTTAWPRIFTGFAGSKTFGRSAEDFEYTSGASRSIVVSTKDANDLATRYIIDGTDGKRPAETIDVRVAWLLASDYVTGLFADHGNVDSAGTLTLDAVDYRGQRPGDVLAACAKKASFNWYVRWSVTFTDFELVFRNDNTSTADTSSISISNVMADVNSTSVFAPFSDAELTEDPEDVYSDVYATYAKGVVTATRAATASAFVTRWGTTDDADIKTSSAADDEADAFLWQSHLEEHALTLTIRMRSAYVGLIRAGQRVSVKLSHLATQGYDSATYFRVLRRRVRQPLDTDNDYDVTLDLSPQEPADIPGDCVDIYPGTASDTFYPLGSFVSDGVVYYYRSGLMVPSFPNPGQVGGWHFSALGAGGLGTIDYAGDCTVNRLMFVTVGNGEWTIQTEMYGGSSRPLFVQVGPAYPGATVATLNSGDPVTITISDATDGDCIRVVAIGDTGTVCGGKWGWSEAVWVAA